MCWLVATAARLFELVVGLAVRDGEMGQTTEVNLVVSLDNALRCSMHIFGSVDEITKPIVAQA